nr:DsbA family protein [Planctomycetota bacterium]
EYRRRKFGSAEHAAARDAQVTAVAARAGLVFDLAGQRRTPNTVLAHRLIWQAGRRGVQDAVVEELFSAYFSAGLDVGDAAVLERIGAAHGLDAVAAFLAGSAGAAEVQAEEEAIRARGIDGVPLFVINGEERIAGAQPAAEFSALLARLAAAGSAGICADGSCSA